jgi:6-phosphofructokinase 2
MKIITLTMNPAIDISTSAAKVAPTHKLRCTTERRDPGGGGINVARVITRLGLDVRAVFPIGGPSGELLRQLVDAERIWSMALPISGETREDLTAFDEEDRLQYRFVLPGPLLAEAEWRSCLEAVQAKSGNGDLIIASGSLPPGVPADFYGRLACSAREAGAKLIVDASGEALAAALKRGLFLVKPSLSELATLAGASLDNERAQLEVCRKLVDGGQAEIVALTRGDKGALLVTCDQAWRADALELEGRTAVGAGDSFLGGVVYSLASSHGLEDTLSWGIAAGCAALLGRGTELCRLEDVRRLRPQVRVSALA